MRAVFAVGAVVLALAPSALADAVYHSSHIALTPVGAAPLHSGFVENIHPDGPNIFAHEQYVLNGARPNTTYTVTIHVGSTSCDPSASLFSLETSTFTTNPAGNASTFHVFTPSDVGALANSTIHAFWTVSTGGSVAYQTTCQTIRLDS
jgi:hypothetical protein